jgi:tRNA(Ile)-lysidine synthase
MLDPALKSAIDSVPPAPWAVGVSGGADSVALLSLLRRRDDLQLTVVHLDHQTRAGASAADAAFVRELCEAWHIPCVIATLAEVEAMLPPRTPPNASVRYRRARLHLFNEVVNERGLRGVVLAHHADDQAETIFHRLMRRAAPGMAFSTRLLNMTVLRPLLRVRRAALRAHLIEQGQAWREDESNASSQYARNRIRRLLKARPALVEPLLELGEDLRAVHEWVEQVTPALPARFHVADVQRLSPWLARRALRAWLSRNSPAPAPETDRAAAERLLEMVTDAASPPRQHFPGGVLVSRRRGELFVDPA